MRYNEPMRKNKHFLVCISASPSSQAVITAASSAASVYHCRLTGLVVNEDLSPQLQKNIDAAASAGAEIHHTKGRNVIQAIAEYARLNGVSDVYIGKPGPMPFFTFHKDAIARLSSLLPDTDIHVIPDAEVILKPSRLHDVRPQLSWAETGKMLLIMAFATLLSFVVFSSRYPNSNIVTIYILAILVTSVVTAERIYGVASAVLFVFLFNYLFIEPRFSLLVYMPEYIGTYIVSVAAALITSTVAARLKESERTAVESAWQSKVLLDTSELLQHAVDEDDIIRLTSLQITQLLSRSVVFYPIRDDKLQKAQYYPTDNEDQGIPADSKAACWVYEHNHHAGAYTNTFPEEPFQYMSVRVSDKMYGVIGIRMHGRDFTEIERNILLSLIGECALSLENNRNTLQREKMEIIAEKERFRNNLLRSISHDLRTPLTSISGNASNLLHHADALDSASRNQIYTDIYDDAMWLIELVENLLSIARLEDGGSLQTSTEIVQDVIDEALKHVDPHIADHHLIVNKDPNMLMADMNVRLISQVVINLVNNAVKYTPAGSDIIISTASESDKVLISVKDNGPGAREEDKPHLFEQFYTGHHAAADSQRSLGLGLYLCKAIVEAHHGKLTYTDNVPHGACFTFMLKRKEVPDAFI